MKRYSLLAQDPAASALVLTSDLVEVDAGVWRRDGDQLRAEVVPDGVASRIFDVRQLDRPLHHRDDFLGERGFVGLDHHQREVGRVQVVVIAHVPVAPHRLQIAVLHVHQGGQGPVEQLRVEVAHRFVVGGDELEGEVLDAAAVVVVGVVPALGAGAVFGGRGHLHGDQRDALFTFAAHQVGEQEGRERDQQRSAHVFLHALGYRIKIPGCRIQ